MKKYYFLIIVALVLALVLTGCSLLSNISQVPSTGQSGITYLTKNGILNLDLVALWHFDEVVGGITSDSSGNPNDGILIGGTSLTSGKFGSALSFDGVDDYVDCGSSGSLDFTTNVTIEAWVYPESIDSLQMIVDNRNVLSSGVQLFYRATTNRIEIQINNTIAADGEIPAGWLDNWHHVLATYTSGVGGSVYIDGIDVSLNVTNRGGIGGTGRTTVIGARYTKATLFFDGVIDEVRIWNRALEDTEIAYNYSLGDIGIDIKPGSNPNSINLGSNGVIPVAILGSDSFNADTVDPLTVKLAGAGVKLKGNSGNAGSLEDVNGDGYPDLVVQVYTENLGLATGEVNAVLSAYTYAGPALTGSDGIRIVPPK